MGPSVCRDGEQWQRGRSFTSPFSPRFPVRVGWVKTLNQPVVTSPNPSSPLPRSSSPNPRRLLSSSQAGRSRRERGRNSGAAGERPRGAAAWSASHRRLPTDGGALTRPHRRQGLRARTRAVGRGSGERWGRPDAATGWGRPRWWPGGAFMEEDAINAESGGCPALRAREDRPQPARARGLQRRWGRYRWWWRPPPPPILPLLKAVVEARRHA
jgi:hypothetical protein